MTTPNAVIAAAASQVGYRATATSGKFCDWYGMQGPWCAMFVSWCAAQAGATAIIPRHSYTPSGVAWFRGRGQWHAGLSGIRRGDIVYYDFPGKPDRVSHVGIVEQVNADGSITTIEGNTSATSSGSQSAGGTVARKRRKAYVVGYGRPAYGSTPTPAPATGLVVDGWLGPATIARWQQVVGTSVDGVISRPRSNLVVRVQGILNSAGCRGYDGRALTVDGRGIYPNTGGKTPKTNTVYALQRYLGTVTDGVLDAPSAAVTALQRQLNTGRF